MPAARFTPHSGEADLTEHLFNRHIIRHLFCKTRGILSFARGKGRDGSDAVAINVRCLEGVPPPA